MLKGKPWTVEEEKQLRKLLEDEASIEVISGKLGKSKQAVNKKIERLGLSEVVVPKGYRTTTSLQSRNDLPSVEEALKILAAALKASAEPGLDEVS